MHTQSDIEIVVINNAFYIWSSSEWLQLRERHRIIGCFDGAEGEGWANEMHTQLPLKLTEIEARYLVTKGWARAVTIPSLKEYKQPVDEKSCAERNVLMEEEELVKYKKRKRVELEWTVDKIIEGKKKKGKPVSDKETIIMEELDKIKEFPYQMTRLDLRDPWISDANKSVYTFTEPCTNLGKLRYRVFEDFHSQGYYLTTGLKFGGDFIAYQGDPLQYHAEYIIMCEVSGRQLPEIHLRSQCRLAAVLNKRLLVASINAETDQLVYKLISRTAFVETKESELREQTE